MTHDDPTPSPAAPDAARSEPLFEHSYDGIQEYDNPMPRWWVLLFWATIVFSAIYALNVVPIVGFGKGWHGNYVDEMAAADAKYGPMRGARPAPADDELHALAADPAALATGKDVWMKNCMPCHRADAGGLIGPNLTDDFWIHGGRPGDIHRVVSAGVLDKGMPAWGVVLEPEAVDRVSAYVLSVHGTHPPDPKAPQGEKASDDDDAHDHGEHAGDGAAPRGAR